MAGYTTVGCPYDTCMLDRNRNKIITNDYKAEIKDIKNERDYNIKWVIQILFQLGDL